MSRSVHLRRAVLLGLAGIGSWATVTASAQDTQVPKQGTTDTARTEQLEEIVVTGTQIRGVAPVGSNVVSVNEEWIESTGAVTTNQLLSQLPQSTDFNEITQPGGGVILANSRVPITRPNVRNLPGAGGSSSGAVTLLLVNGHRIVSQGIEQTAVDADVVAPDMNQRVEIILDGASATYGSDATGGVINFITRKSFDGIKADVRYGVADDYESFDTNLTGGASWGSGSFFATYSYADSDALFGRDRDYARSINWTTGIPTGRQCDAANVLIGTASFTVPTLAPGFNSCDSGEDSTITPSVERHNAYAALSQNLSDSVTFDIDALYSRRENLATQGPFRANATNLRPTNPYYRQIPGTAAGAPQTVQFNYGAVFGNDAQDNQTVIEVGQVTPAVTIDLGDNWEVRALIGYGESKTSTSNPTLFTPLQTSYVNGTTLNTAINPYDIAATQNRALFDDLIYNAFTSGEYEFLNPSAIIDGKLFGLRGGDVRGALGVEYAKTDFEVVRTDATTRLRTPPVSASQDVTSAFAEVLIPVVGAGNSMPGIQKLELSLSGRYDEYSDFGSEFSPKVAVTWGPAEWLTLRGTWGESFNAPTVADKLGAETALMRLITPPIQVPAGTQTPPGLTVQQTGQLLLTGAVPDLEPQSATGWTAGFDIRTPIDLTLSATYYYIDFKNIISLPQTTASAQAAFANFPELYPFYPNLTPQQVLDFSTQAPNGPAVLQSAVQQGIFIVNLFDNRTRNLGGTEVSGVDVQVQYSHATGFGSFDASLNGNYQFQRDTTIRPGGATVDDLLYGLPDLRAALTIGANVQDFRAQATLNHTSGYDLDPATANLCPCQRSVDQFDVVNLFFRYNFNGTGLLNDLALTLNVNNASDEEPPVYKVNGGSGFANGRTVGRLWQFGISKTF